MDFIPFRDRLVAFDTAAVLRLYKECTPKLLVVTDSLNYNPAAGFSLHQFVQSLKAGKVHGMTPIVTTASRAFDGNADISSFTFNDPTKGLTRARYDVVFIFGRNGSGASLPAAELTAIATFMEAGGGLFATGDHETLGAPLCGDIPRVRAMRKWTAASSPPDAANDTRLSTNLSGPDEVEEFSDQSNSEPQRLYVNYRTKAGGMGIPHPLLQLKAPRRVLEVFPDHPHEGECLVPGNLTTTFTLNGASVPEWPRDVRGATVPPEVVATSVSNGSGFNREGLIKQPLMPRLFNSIVAWDGHRASKGRVSVDSTWHHFININLDGSDEPGFLGLQTAPGVDSEALTRIREHFVNLANWLMPASVRKCLRFPLLLTELQRYPLAEELNLVPLKAATAPQLQAAGSLLVASLSRRMSPWQVEALLQDALADAAGDAQLQQLQAAADDGSALSAARLRELSLSCLGGVLTGVAQRLADLPSLQAIVPHETLELAAGQAAAQALSKAVKASRAQWQNWDSVLGKLPLVNI
jgi:hypothetical protein